MESYLIKSSICLAILYVAYKFLLKHESNHHLKRFVSLFSIVFSCLFLFIPLGSLLIADTYPELVNVVFMQGSEGFQEGFSRVITKDVTSIYLTIYFLGLIVFGIRSLVGLGMLIYWYVSSKRMKKWGFTVVQVDKNIAPFTFFRTLFIGKEVLHEEAMKTLIVHEQYHRDQWHSIDTVLLEILTIFYWFNPFIWLFQKEIKTEHEYMADAQVLKKGFDAVEYQYLLFQTKTGTLLPLASHLSNKTSLKKRFKMMNKKHAKTKRSYVRVLLFFPLLGMILISSGFLEANNNLSNEILLLKERSNSKLDTIPTKEQLENEKFQFMIQGNSDKENKVPIYILKDGKKEKIVDLVYIKELKKKGIKTVYVLKGKSAQKKYGKKGENGVVVVELKKEKNE